MMTDLRRTQPTQPYRALLTRSAAWIGGMGFLSSGMLWAQTAPAPAPAAPPAPAAIDLTPVAVPAAPSLTVESTPASPTTLAAPVPVAPPTATAPATPSPQVILTPPAKSSTASSAGNAYIDPTNYNLGATDYEAPTAIVLTERSTGCQQVLRGGQSVANGVCPPEPAPAAARWSGNNSAAPTPTWVNRQATAMRVGPLSPDQSGLAGGPSPYALYYYNQTPRPLGLPGNGNISLLFPLSIPAPITSLFGWRTHPISGDVRFHSGTDLGAPMGTPVVAAYAGRVTAADFLGGYGLSIVIGHKNLTQETLYAHLSEIFVQPGEWVDQGTVIGRVGSTGNSTGPHLHFEFRQMTPDGWVALDPGQQLQVALAQLTNPVQWVQGEFKPTGTISFSGGLTLEAVFPVAQVPPQPQAPLNLQSQFQPVTPAPVLGLLPENQAAQ